MKRLFKTLLLLSAVLTVLALVGGTVIWHQLSVQPDFSVSINGEDLDLQGLGAGHGIGDWFGTVLGLFIATLVACIVVPLALLLGFGLPLLILALVFGGMLIGVVGLGALLFSPLLLPLLILWLLLRRRPTKRPPLNANIAA